MIETVKFWIAVKLYFHHKMYCRDCKRDTKTKSEQAELKSVCGIETRLLYK